MRAWGARLQDICIVLVFDAVFDEEENVGVFIFRACSGWRHRFAFGSYRALCAPCHVGVRIAQPGHLDYMEI